MILVPGDQLADGLRVHLPGCVVGGLWRERLIALSAEDPAAQSHVQTDGSRLVDDHDAVPVGIIQNVFAVWIVRRPERVGANPVQQLEIMYQVGIVVALADHRQILVLAEAGEIERLAVDQESNSVHLDGAYADALVVAVHDGVPAYELNLKVVKVAISWGPLMHLWNAQCAARSGVGCDLGSVGVSQDHLYLDDRRRASASTGYPTTPLSPSRSVVIVTSVM